MDVHVLNGDSLANKFPVSGKSIVFREALIDGPVRSKTLSNFWKVRASYISAAYGEDEAFYLTRVKYEFEKLKNLEDVASITLWFEHDLYCQVNMWFVLHYLAENKIYFPVYRVMPSSDSEYVWAGFGQIGKDALNYCFERRKPFSQNDIEMGISLWKTYQAHDMEMFKKLSSYQSELFPYLDEVCEAHIQRFPINGLGRPQSRLRQLQSMGTTNFVDIFREFSKTEGIYGFGDSQVRHMLAGL